LTKRGCTTEFKTSQSISIGVNERWPQLSLEVLETICLGKKILDISLVPQEIPG